MKCQRGHETGGGKCRECLNLRTKKYAAVLRKRTADKRTEAVRGWLPKLSGVEKAWAAGLFEGEGTVTISSAGRHGYTLANVQVTNTDKEVVDFFQERWRGMSKTYHPKNPNHRTKYVWYLSGRKALEFVKQVLPFIRTARVRGKMNLLIEVESGRSQGSHDPDYKAKCQAAMNKMRELNRRGPK